MADFIDGLHYYDLIFQCLNLPIFAAWKIATWI